MKKIILILASLFTIQLNAKEYNDAEAFDKQNNPTLTTLTNSDLKVQLPEYIFSNTNTTITFEFVNPNNQKLIDNNYKLDFIVNGENQTVVFDNKGVGKIDIKFASSQSLSVFYENFAYKTNLSVIPLWMVITPILLLVSFIAFRIVRGKKKKKASSSVKEIVTEKETELV